MSRRGVALVLVLWVLVVLSFVGLEAGLFARADTGSTRALAERLQARYLAHAAVERGLGLLQDYSLEHPANPLLARTLGEDRADTGPRPPLLAYLAARGVADVPLGPGRYSVRFEDLSGLVNVNRVDPELLANLVEQTGVDRSTATAVADAILDWVDADDLYRARGAERDAYERRGLTAPRNAPVVDLGELRLVQGVTPEILHGGGRLRGLARFLTTEGSGKINVNTAPPEVLLSVPGLDRATVTRILAERERRHLRSLDDAVGPDAAQRLAADPALGVLAFETTEMRIDGIGVVPGGTTGRARATVGLLPAAIVLRTWQEDAGAALALAPGATIRLPERP